MCAKNHPRFRLILLVLFIIARGVDSISHCERRGQYTSKRSGVIIGIEAAISLIDAHGNCQSAELTLPMGWLRQDCIISNVIGVFQYGENGYSARSEIMPVFAWKKAEIFFACL